MAGSNFPGGVRGLRQYEAAAAIRDGNSIASLYLLHGGQALLEEEFLRLLRERLIPAGTRDFNLHVVDPGPDQVQQVLGLVQTLPFMAERRLVVMKKSPLFSARRSGRTQAGAEEESAPAGGEEKALLAYLQQPAPYVCLVITVEGEPDRRRNLTRAVAKAGVLVDCSEPSAEEAANWCQVRAERLGARLEPAAARLLVEKAGTDLTRLKSEVEKLALYAAGRAIGEEAVLVLVSGAAQAQVFDLTDAVAEGRGGDAAAHLEQMLQQGEHPVRLLALLASHFRRLLEARGLAARGIRPTQAAQRRKQHSYYWEKLMRQARRFQEKQLVWALERILETDLALKSSSGDERLLMELLLVDLAAMRASGERA